MCGFSGIIIKKDIISKTKMEMLVKNSLEKIKFRGPDQSKIIFDEIDNFYICIGFNRLSILDLSDDSM